MKKFLSAVILILLSAMLLSLAGQAAVDNSSIIVGKAYGQRYYDQLDSEAKQLYDAIYEKREEMMTGDASLRFELALTLSKMQSNFSSAFSALRMDYPMFYYVDISKISAGYTSYEGASVTKTITVSVHGDYSNYYRGEYTGTTQLKEELQSVENVINTVTTEASKLPDGYSKLKYVHDWLVEHNSYNEYVANGNSSAAPESAWTVVSAFLSGGDSKKGPVCEGYSKAFMVCAQRLGFECALIAGTGITSALSGGHMWNAVKVDGKWYAVDVTWDDPITNAVITETRTNYFLVGLNSDVGSGKTFSAMHVTDMGSYMQADFTPPVLEKSAYAYTESVMTSCSASSPGAVYGESLTVSVNVTASETVDSGLASVYNGDTLSGSSQVVNGKATVTVTLPAGDYTLKVIYEGAGRFSASETTVNCSVEKKKLTVSCTGIVVEDKLADGTPDAVVSVYDLYFTGEVNGDKPIPSGYTVSASFEDAEPGEGKPVKLTFTGIATGDANYTCDPTLEAAATGSVLPATDARTTSAPDTGLTDSQTNGHMTSSETNDNTGVTTPDSTSRTGANQFGTDRITVIIIVLFSAAALMLVLLIVLIVVIVKRSK